MDNQDIVVIIPALNPDNKLIEYVDRLLNSGFNDIILIDDGSDSHHKNIFKELQQKCHLITHAVNMGKGRALKDAFNYYLSEYDTEKYKGVITVDSDGQHTVEDVKLLAERLLLGGKELIIGVRDFDSKNVPFKSKFGNKLTKAVIKLLYGGNISDTQTGLRGAPNEVLLKYLTLSGERFEYETTMLIKTLQDKISIFEIPIETVYLNENKGTHFRPVQDSIAIYAIILGTFFKYTLSSLSSSLIDLGMFSVFIAMLSKSSVEYRIGMATVGARVISALFNYCVNKNIVFSDKTKKGNTLFKYFALCIVQMGLSAVFVYCLHSIMRIPEVPVKILVDTVLFLISFQIQRRVIFTRQ